MPSHHENHQPVSHLARTRLELKKIINIARGAPINAWPPKEEWEIRFKMLKDAIEDRDLPAKLAPLAPRHSSVRLDDVWAFLEKQPPHPKWDWLHEFCEVWSKESGVALDAQQISTIAAENRCKDWLVGLMSNDGAPDRLKSAYRFEAKSEFGVGTRAFDRAWQNAIAETGNSAWSNPGRKS